MKRRLLILANAGERPGVRADLESLAERIPKLAPEIDVVVIGHRHREQRKLLLRAFRPSLAVGFGPIRSRRFPAGEVLHCPRIEKHVEMERLRAAGIPVPDWAVLTPGVALDPAVWGPYVVVKPTHAERGAEVRIRRTGRVRYEPPESFPAEHPGREGPMLAQRFVYTGPWATCYRVGTFFGRALYCWRVEQSHAKRRLESRFDFGGFPENGGGGIQIIAPSKTSTYTLAGDEDVLELAERAHRLAFPDYPYLGVDLLRDADTGELQVIEVNSGGAVWHLSTRMGADIQKLHGIDFYGQLGALDRAAERLVELTRTRAKRAPFGRKAEQYRAI